MARGVSPQCEALWNLEDLISRISEARGHIRIVRQTIRARLKTTREAADLRELEQADRTLEMLKDELARWHPSALERK